MWNSAVAIVLTDARTLALSPFSDVTATARSGAYQDSTYRVAITEDNVRLGRHAIGLGMEHPGTFDLTVSAKGYKPWTRNNFITANNLRCGYVSDTIVARLERL